MTEIKKGNYGSTDDPLGVGAKYDTGAMGSKGTSRIKGTVYADEAGTLRIFQGMSEARPDDIVTEIAVAACANPGDGEGFTIDCVGQFFKIEYENGGVAQTVFRLGWKIGNLTF